MSAVAIVSPGYPDSPGGVTDQTARLMRHFEEHGTATTILASLEADVRSTTDGWVAKDVQAVLIQYVPFLYARRGVSRFPERIARFAKRRGIRVVTFVHEPWVPPTRLPWLVLSPLQRRQLRRLLGYSDVTLTPVPKWRELLGPGTEVLAVGSNLGDAPTMSSLPPLDAPAVFSPFAAGLRWDWIVAACQAIGARLVVLGADEAAARQHPTVGSYFDPTWEWRGRLPAAEVLQALGRAPLVLAPFIDGMTGRRTSALAALSVGARTVSSEGPLFDPLYRTSPMLLANSREEFADEAARTWNTSDTAEARAQRIAWYHEHVDAHKLDDRLLALLLDR